MLTVPLHGKTARGRAVLIDDEDLGLVEGYSWNVAQRDRTAYARAYVRGSFGATGRRVMVSMHKLITGWPLTDHINGDGLDNQRANLRPATSRQNSANMRGRVGATSQYKGVCWVPYPGRWQASLKVAGHQTHLGWFDTEEEAARAYDAAAFAVHGEYARLNLPLRV